MRQKPMFGAFAPRGEKGSRERLKRLAEVLPDNTWNKTRLKNKKSAYRVNSANCNLAVSFLRSEATLALPLGELAAP